MAESRHRKARRAKPRSVSLTKSLLPATVPVAGLALVVSAAAATAVTSPADATVGSAALVVAENPSEGDAVDRNFVRTDVADDESRIARSSASEDGTKFANRETAVRSAPTSSSDSVAGLEEGDEVTVTSQTSRGFTLVLHDGAERWVNTDHLDDEAPAEEEELAADADGDSASDESAEAGGGADSSPSAGTVDGDNPGATAANAALSRVGDAYVRGGAAPGGFDCSGLTSWAYSQAGISLPRTSGAQAGYGTQISRGDLSPGDLVHWPGHVAMYVGSGNIVHASRPGVPVQVVSIERGFGSAPTGYTRPWS